MNNHKDLKVWQKSIDLVVTVYKTTGDFPKEELFGIVSQMRRSAISIPSNIAEGYGRIYDKETAKFLSNALGSATELETQLIISKELGYLSLDNYQMQISQIEEIIRMLSSLIKSLDN